MQSLLTYVFVLFWTVLASGQTVHTVYDFTINVVEMRESHGFDRGMDKSERLAVYGWSADGARLWVRDGSGDGLDYLGSLTLSTEGGETRLETAAVVGGVIRVGSDGRQTAECHVTDHLGSVRVVVDGAGNVLERNDYYPFGARYGEEGWPESANRFKFNGKEEQVTGDLGFLDYGARMYDPAVGRWWSVDPAAGEFCSLSVYSYCGNSPLVNMEPDGSWFTRYVDKDYNTLFQTDDGSEDIVMVPGGYIQDFERYAAMYASSAGMRSLFDSQGWNSHWRQEFGLAPRQLTEGQLAVLELFNSEWAKDKAVRNMLNPSGGNMVSMAFAEALSQWTNPELVVGGLSVGLAKFSSVAGTKRVSNNVKIGQLVINKRSTYQHMFSRHAKAFGVNEGWNKKTAGDFENVLRKHMKRAIPIKGYFRNEKALHYFDPYSWLNVSTRLNGELLGGWQLSKDQVKYLFLNGVIK